MRTLENCALEVTSVEERMINGQKALVIAHKLDATSTKLISKKNPQKTQIKVRNMQLKW